jgi:hypothetical protein
LNVEKKLTEAKVILKKTFFLPVRKVPTPVITTALVQSFSILFGVWVVSAVAICKG